MGNPRNIVQVGADSRSARLAMIKRPGDVQPDGMARRGRSRTCRFLKGSALVVAVLVSALVLAGAGYYLSLLPVGDANASAEDPRPASRSVHGRAASGEARGRGRRRRRRPLLFGYRPRRGQAALSSRSSGDPEGSTIPQQVANLPCNDGSGLGSIIEDVGLAINLSTAGARQVDGTRRTLRAHEPEASGAKGPNSL